MAKQPPEGDSATVPSEPNLPQLEELVYFLERPEENKFNTMLETEIIEAKKLLKDAMRKHRRKTLPFNTEIMRVLKKFKEPKPITHDVIVAFFLLLGEYEGDTRVFLSFV